MGTIVPLLVLGASVAAAITLMRWKARDKKVDSLFVADPNNDTSISMCGWNRTELDKILNDFLRLYKLPDASTLRAAEKSDHVFVVTFPNDIQPDTLFYLVNYINYPEHFDLEHRSIGVLGRVLLTPAHGAPDPALVGKRAKIYVPDQDTDYDLVYAQVESGQAYKISFTNLIWQPMQEARVPAVVVGL